MKQITYGIYAEDTANDIFIKNAIPQLIAHFDCKDKIYFKHEEEFTEIMVAKNGKFVQENFTKYVAQGIKRYELELCFVGLDADDADFIGIYEKMIKKLQRNKLEKYALIFIPVQAIEYWLWYLKVKAERPEIENTTIIDVSKLRSEMKVLVYGSKKPVNKKSNPIVNELSKNINFDWLNAHSVSFKHFYHQFENYIKTKIAAEEKE